MKSLIPCADAAHVTSVALDVRLSANWSRSVEFQQGQKKYKECCHLMYWKLFSPT